MEQLRSLKEALEISAVRLVDKRQKVVVGDIFRLSPVAGLFLWGRLIKRSRFFGLDAPFNLVYIYDAFGPQRPASELLSRENLIIGASVVNNLGWVRGYWEIVASEPIRSNDTLDQHLFVRYRGASKKFDIVNENGNIVRYAQSDISKLSHSGFGNFNSIDWRLRPILRDRGLLPLRVMHRATLPYYRQSGDNRESAKGTGCRQYKTLPRVECHSYAGAPWG